MDEEDHEKLLLCPYNCAHEIIVSRLKEHVTRCGKNHQDSIMQRCPYNTTHIVSEPEMQYHLEHCEDRRPIELQVYNEEGTNANAFPVENKEVTSEESWDNLDVPAYNPQEVCVNKEVLRQIRVEPAATRRKFRQEEIRRHNEMTCRSSDRSQQAGSSTQSSKQENLPNRATGTILLENDPETVRKLHERIKIPPIPVIPGKPKSTRSKQ